MDYALIVHRLRGMLNPARFRLLERSADVGKAKPQLE